jgi:two-component system sensor histidine kinase RegB
MREKVGVNGWLNNLLWPSVPTGQMDDPEESRIKLGWLIRLRWVAVVGQALSSVIGLSLGYLAPEFFSFFCVVILALGFWNVATMALLYKRKSRITSQDLAVQMIADIGALTLLLSMSGGIFNPLSSILLIHGGFSVLFMGPLGQIIILLAICASLAFLQWDPDISHLSITGATTRHSIFFSYLLVALFVSGLAAWLAHSAQRLRLKVRVLEQQKDRLDRLRVAGAMAAGFSHEFSTPLYNLKLRLDRLSRKLTADVPDGAGEDLASARDSAQECEAILHALTRNGLKSDQLRLERKDASALFKEWSDEFSALETESRLRLEDVLDRKVEIDIPVYPLKQSYFDLLENAHEASMSGELVSVRIRSSTNALHVSVENKGDPISPLIFDKWGEPFVTTKENGTGLGLFNAITLLQAMGGGLEANNLPGSIVRIEFSIPAAPPS